MTGPVPGRTWPDVLTSLLQGDDLTAETTAWAMREVMSGEASPVQLAGFLVALRAKGETVAELGALADVMLEHAMPISVPGETLDIVGTGGDRANTVNISTMSAICIAATGTTVVKHGNRASSSRSGSADVLEALGVDLSLPPEEIAALAGTAGITFLFANHFHPSMRHAAVARRELGVATAFNVLGPLTNPARPTYSVIGVANRQVAPRIAGVFAERGREAAVFRGDDGLDELTLTTTSTMWWVTGGAVTEVVVDPEAVGLRRAPIEALRGGDAEENAAVARAVFAGQPGPVRDAVLLNAGTGVALATAAGGPVADPVEAVRAGVARVAEVIDSGGAQAQLERWVQASQEARARTV